MGRELGFVAAAAPTVRWGNEVVSSTRVRRAVGEGRVADARGMLGRAVYVDGTVLEGKRLGRKLGFPTLNLDVENELRPGAGVYVTASHIPSFDRTFPSVTNIGVRPTVYESSITTVETHVLDFTADVYREPVRLFFLERLREERAFGSPIELMAQIRRDVEAARRFFAEHPLETAPICW
jgi:riboflavin kinase/FMN adenylyltransferase